MADNFPRMLKSTIDKMISDKVAALQATYPTLQWAEVDDMHQTEEVFNADGPAILWQFSSLFPEPRRPFYGLEFSVGAKTVGDPGNYDLFDLVAQIADVFKGDSSFDIFDYVRLITDPVDTVSKGFVRVVSNEIAPQQFDRQSGIRYAIVRGKVARYGS